MKVKAIKCKKCLDIIYSRAQHDMHWCSCHSVAIDGGREMTQTLGNEEDYDDLEIEIEATDRELYDDWNKTEEGTEGKFGWIHKKTVLRKIDPPASKT